MPIVRGCRGAGREELRASIVTQVFPTVVQRVLSSDDSAILQVQCTITYFPCLRVLNFFRQNGGECIRAFVATAVEQLAEWYVRSSDLSGGHVMIM